MRTSQIIRDTAETKITLQMNIDGNGKSNVETGCGFLDHMLTLFAKHGQIDLDIKCKGDTYVDYHHTVEDIGICIGKGLRDALGEMRGIKRYGNIILPMDEALILCALDISGREYLEYAIDIPTEKVGDFDTELAQEFMLALVRNSRITLHFKQFSGTNSHHIIEAMFKALGRTLREAVTIDENCKDEIPSTKGVL